MGDSIQKRGRKFIRKFSRVTTKASAEGKEHIKENLFARIGHVGNIKLLILEWGLLILALVLLAVTQAFWYAGSYAEDVFTDGGNYIEATLGDVSSMNPLFATTDSEKVLSRLLFATLSKNDYSGRPGIGLAKSITADENGKTWVVKLRENLKWSDGEPITNEDVVFTAELIKNPKVDTIYDSNLANVKVSINEDSEIIFSLPTAYADFMSALNIPILPKHILEDSSPETLIENAFSSTPISSGPFAYNALQSTSKSDEKIIYLSSNPYYYGGETMVNSFAIHTYQNKEDIIAALNAGTVTATAELTESDREAVTSGQFLEKNSSLNSGAFIFFNTKNASVKNVEMRRAIRQGIDVSRIREQAPNTEALNLPLLASQIELEKYPEIPARNKEEAVNQISALIGEEEAPTLNIATVNVGFLPTVTRTLAEELEGLGFKTNVMVYEENQDFMIFFVSLCLSVFVLGLNLPVTR